MIKPTLMAQNYYNLFGSPRSLSLLDQAVPPVKSRFFWLAGLAARVLPTGIKRLFYRLGPFSRLIRKGLNLSVSSELQEVVIAGGRLAGYHMLLDLKQEKDFWLGTYETHLQEALEDWIIPGAVVFDVGANIGYISLLMARRIGVDGHVYAFEALPANLERLRKNAALNDRGAQISISHQAIVESTGPVEFKVHESIGMGKATGSAGRDETYDQILEVPGASLDDLVYIQGLPVPDALKIDIEGGEVLAMPGMTRLLHEAKPILLIELHGQAAAESAWHHLIGAGYTIRTMTPGYPPVERLDMLDWKAYIIAQPMSDNSHE
jgi:FkbM family methyltransferase